MVGKSLCSKHTRHNARSGVLALILLAAFAQGSARAEDVWRRELPSADSVRIRPRPL